MALFNKIPKKESRYNKKQWKKVKSTRLSNILDFKDEENIV